MTFTWIDLAIVVLVLLSAAFGLIRGFVKEVFSLVVWAAALVLALLFSSDVAALLGVIPYELIRDVVAFVCVFVATLVVGTLVQMVLPRLVNGSGMTGLNRTLGLLFGGVRGAVVCALVLIAARPFVEDEVYWRDSAVVPSFMAFEEEILAFFHATKDMAGDLVSGSL